MQAEAKSIQCTLGIPVNTKYIAGVCVRARIKFSAITTQREVAHNVRQTSIGVWLEGNRRGGYGGLVVSEYLNHRPCSVGSAVHGLHEIHAG